MLKRFAAGLLATLFVAGPAWAEPAIYTWTGYGLNVPGSGKCPTYKMVIDVTVVGTDVHNTIHTVLVKKLDGARQWIVEGMADNVNPKAPD